MQVQLNTDHHITGSEELAARVQAELLAALRRFADRITRIEVHLNVLNAGKGGADDVRCMLEARPRGHAPLAVEDRAVSVDLALRGATDKLLSALEHLLGRLDDVRGGRPGNGNALAG